MEKLDDGRYVITAQERVDYLALVRWKAQLERTASKKRQDAKASRQAKVDRLKRAAAPFESRRQ